MRRKLPKLRTLPSTSDVVWIHSEYAFSCPPISQCHTIHRCAQSDIKLLLSSRFWPISISLHACAGFEDIWTGFSGVEEFGSLKSEGEGYPDKRGENRPESSKTMTRIYEELSD